jgi:pyridoxamine 5'-phosphate oxidase family protein
MSAFTDAEIAYLRSQRLARIATASLSGAPDVAAVGFGLDGDDLVTGGFDIRKTVRYRYLLDNPRATIVIDDLATIDPWSPRGVKVRGTTLIEGPETSLRVRITPEVIWSWGINLGAETRFKGIERRDVPRG